MCAVDVVRLRSFLGRSEGFDTSIGTIIITLPMLR